MHRVRSADGTDIAFDRLGSGPPVIMVAGAFNTRATTGPLATALQDRFTILNYDRRGRGDSGDTLPYAVEREIEDLDALIAEAGGSSAVFGYSSGATLALKAAARGLTITKLALYEPPFLVDGSRPPLPADLPDQLAPSWSPPVGEVRRSSSTRRRPWASPRRSSSACVMHPSAPSLRRSPTPLSTRR